MALRFCLLVVVLTSGCAQTYLKGATLTRKNLADESIADFEVDNCRSVATGEYAEGPRGTTYHLVDFKGQWALFEKGRGGSSVITNSWREADGTHYFSYVMADGWEFVIPDSGNGKRLVRRGGTKRGGDGTARPSDKPPQFVCDLVVTHDARRRSSGELASSSSPPGAQPIETRPAPIPGTRAPLTPTGGNALVAEAPSQQVGSLDEGVETTRVSLFGKDREAWTVNVGGRSCATPCTLRLLPGAYRVEAERDDMRVTGQVAVPAFASHIMVQRPGSPAVLWTGVAVAALGVITMFVGAVGRPYDTAWYLSFLVPGGTASLTGLFMMIGALTDHGKVVLKRGEPTRL